MQLALNVILFALGFSCAAVASTKRRQSRATLKHVLENVNYLLSTIRAWVGLGFGGSGPAPADNDVGLQEGKIENTLSTKAEVEQQYQSGTWQRNAYEDFKDTLLSRERIFPCIYATKGYRTSQHRYVFLESQNPNEARNLRRISRALQEYLEMAPSLGDLTSLVIIATPQPVGTELTIDDYRKQFWNMLRGVHIADPKHWPSDVPTKTESDRWVFCFDGVPVFPVALTPAHERRASRHANSFVVALQPKWILDKLLKTPEKRQAAQSKVRTLLKCYDGIGISPDLTSYGQPGSSEARQLFLLDKNETSPCPFTDLDC